MSTPASSTTPKPFRPRILPTIAVAIMLPVLISLGTWQWGRANFKAAIEAKVDARTGEGPLRIEEWLASPGLRHDIEALHYRDVVAEGRLDVSRQFLLDNRTLNGKAGYHALAPLVLSTGSVVLVDRGWVLAPPDRSVLPSIGFESGAPTLAGTAAPPPSPGILLGESGYENAGWPRVVQLVDFAAVESAVGSPVIPIVIRMSESDPRGLTREWPLHGRMTPDKHRGYAVQWYSLAVALLTLYLIYGVRWPRRKRSAS